MRFDIRPIRLLILAASLVAAGARASAETGPGDLDVDMRARSLQPGEVVRFDIEWTDVPPRSISVAAFDTEVPCVPAGRHTCRALVPIDLDTAPGEYVVSIDSTRAGETTTHTRHLTVLEKDFPTRTLRVDPDYVHPPRPVERRIEREAILLRAIFDSATPVTAWRGPFAVPVPTDVNSGFGTRSVFNGEPRSPHGGADFAVRAGTPVRAPNGGKVVLARNLYFTGNTVVIDHGAGLYSLLAHLSRMRVKAGTIVKRGAVVGHVGATGRATGPHLHWTVRLAGARVDPMSLVYATKPDEVARATAP